MFALAAAIKPFVFFLFIVGILLPVRFCVIKWMPEGKIKRILLFRITR